MEFLTIAKNFKCSKNFAKIWIFGNVGVKLGEYPKYCENKFWYKNITQTLRGINKQKKNYRNFWNKKSENFGSIVEIYEQSVWENISWKKLGKFL